MKKRDLQKFEKLLLAQREQLLGNARRALSEALREIEDALAALQRLHEGTQTIPNATAEAHPATAHMYIDNPLSGGGMASLFSTHPPMEERIARLRAMVSGRTEDFRTAAGPMNVRRGGSVPQSAEKGPWG